MSSLWKNLFKKKPLFLDDFSRQSYSQDGEDMILDSVLDDAGGRPNGFFIDVGAHHPLRFSNTAYFSKKGWRGINIEPTPDAITLFTALRPQDINLNYGVSDEDGALDFYIFDEPALNSFSKNLSEQRASTTNYRIIEVVKIPVRRLDDILDQHLPEGQHIDFLTIDVEGLDLQVLKSNNWDKYRPDFLFVEDPVDLDFLEDTETNTFLKGQGYVLLAKTPRTLLYKRGV